LSTKGWMSSLDKLSNYQSVKEHVVISEKKTQQDKKKHGQIFESPLNLDS
jgi:hypothetical protein